MFRVLLVLVWMNLEKVSSKRLWTDTSKGQSPSGITAGNNTEPKLGTDLGTQLMFQMLFHLVGKQKSKQNLNDLTHLSKSVEDFEAIQRAIQSFGPLDFAEDTQKILERGDEDTSIYRHLHGEKGGSIVFRRPSDGQGKKLILVTRAEDNLRIGTTKRTSVVLKQNPQVPDHYFVLYTYIR